MRKLYVSDVDGTLERWHVGMKWMGALSDNHPAIKHLLQEAAPHLQAYKERRGSFNTFAEFVVREFWTKRRYVGIRHEDSERAARTALQAGGDHFYVFTHELLFAAKDLGYATAAISGSPQDAVEVFLERFGVDIIRGTVHAMENGAYVDAPVAAEPVTNKGAALRDIIKELGDVGLDGSVAIGDSPSDIPMLEQVEYPICFKPNDELKKEAWARNWPIVVEDRNTHLITVYDVATQRRFETNLLTDVLPLDLAQRLKERMAARTW